MVLSNSPLRLACPRCLAFALKPGRSTENRT
jgi:hypothetical protein